MKSTQSTLLTIVLTVCLLVVPHAARADETPTTSAWQALPSETFAAIHLPSAQDFVDTLRERTHFGQVALSQDQLQAYAELFRDAIGEDVGKIRQELNRFGLELDDWADLFRGPAGFGATLEQRDNGDPYFVLLLWAEPGEDLASRLVHALELALEEAAANNEDPRRIDTQLANTHVIHFSSPEFDYDVLPHTDDLPDDFENMTDEQWDAHFEQQARAYEDAEWTIVDRTNIMVARLGGRLVAAITPPQSSDRVREHLADNADPDWDELTGANIAMGTLARFLEAQQADEGPAESFGHRMLANPGMSAALGEGVTLVDMFLDAPPLLAMIRQQIDDPEADRYFETLGLNNLGPVGYRMALDGNNMRTALFLAAPSQRRGVIGLLDQPTQQPQPPAWVASDVLSYAHFSVDLGQVYDTIKDITIDLVGDGARQGYQDMEMQAQMFLQATPRDLLAGLGSRHIVLEYPLQIVEMEMPDYAAGVNPMTGEMVTTTEQVPQQRIAYVWQLDDAPAWARMFQVIGQFAPMAGGAVQPASEQGFEGFRMEEGGMSLALFHGRGHMVLTLGSDVAARTLSMLNNPPQGADALLASDLQARAAALTPTRPGLVYGVADAGRSMSHLRNLLPAFWDVLETDLEDEFDGPIPFDMDRLEALLPSADDLKASFGVSVSHAHTTDDGLVAEVILEMSPAE